jgi:selenocysteine-specific elongation factor
VMLVIAADESVMPQTREHLDICSLLRVKRGFAVLTKIDAADPELADLAEVETQELLKGTFLEGSPILRVSARTGEGIPQLIEALRAYSSEVPPRDPAQPFRLPIDRCFTMKGFGTVVSGTLIAGRVRRDDDVEILPGGIPTRVRGVQVHGVPVDEARAGQRTALNLQRVDLPDVERGMVLTAPGVFRASTTFDVHLELLPSAPGPIVRRKRVRFHVGTAEVMGYVVLLGRDTLPPGESAFAQVRLERPAFALPGDRFIIRQYSPMLTLGGGEILDAHAPRHRRSDRSVPSRLEALQHGTPAGRVLTLIEDAGTRTAELPAIVTRLGIRPEDAESRVRSLAAEGKVRILNEHPLTAVPSGTFARAAEAVQQTVIRFHQTDPLVKGIGREDLKARALRDASPVLFRAVVDDLVAGRRLAADGDVLHVFGRTVVLADEDARAREQLEGRFRELGLEGMRPDDVIEALGLDRQKGRRIVQLLVREQVLQKINDDMTVDRAALLKLIADVKALKERTSTFDVKEFKELTGLSRKFAVPLLEYLDSQRVTRRAGDRRVIL